MFPVTSKLPVALRSDILAVFAINVDVSTNSNAVKLLLPILPFGVDVTTVLLPNSSSPVGLSSSTVLPI